MESTRSGPRRRSTRLISSALGDGTDLISLLPDDLLLRILARLGCASAAARTGVLSRRWRGLWARLHRIFFKDVEFHALAAALRCFPPAPPAVSLQIRVPKPGGRVLPKEHRVDDASFRSLLRAAARLDPEELSLVLPTRFVCRPLRLKLPSFHRATSIALDLCSTVNCVPSSAEFLALKTLSLSRCRADLEALISRCPQLRTLRLADIYLHKYVLTVNAPLLEEIVVANETWIRHVNIDAPLLKQLTMSFKACNEGAISVVAPMVKVSWDCYLSSMNIKFGLWRLQQLSLQAPERQGQLPSLHIHACIRPSTIYDIEAGNLTQEIEKHMIAEFAVLELHLNTRGHVFGALAFRVLEMNQVCSAMQWLKVILKRSTVKEECPVDCSCEPSNWRSQTISLNALQVVDINGFQGDDHEIDFLKLIFKCAPMLKRVTLKLLDEGSSRNDGCMEIYNIFRAYSSVECYVYLGSGLMHGSQNCPSA